MEMEINPYNQPKKVHHHVMPIVIIAIVIAIVSTPYLVQQSMPNGGGAALIHDLSTHPLRVTPTTKGYAHVTLNTTQAGTYVSPEVNQAGQTSDLLLQLPSPKL
jgi:hypothetical protein